MTAYQLGIFAIHSDLALPELPTTRCDGVPDCVLRVSGERADRSGECLFEWQRDGNVWLSCHKTAGAYVLRFDGLADFVVSRCGRAVDIWSAIDVPAATVRHLFLDQVFPLALSLRGETALHASAVLTPSGAVAFLGPSGSGKSTLAASFACEGSRIVADDLVVLRDEAGLLCALPAYPGLRLWPDACDALSLIGAAAGEVAHYSDKQRLFFDCSDGGHRSVPLRRVYVLSPTDDCGTSDISVRPLSARQTLVELLAHAYRLDGSDREALAAEFGRAERLAQLCRASRLEFPMDFDRLIDVRRAVLKDLSDGR